MMTSCYALGVLAVWVIVLEKVSHHHRVQALFSILPLPLWCYGLPALAVGLGLLPAGAEHYNLATRWGLPWSLTLLLLTADLRPLTRLGKPLLVLIGIGPLTIISGLWLALKVGRWLHWNLTEPVKSAGALAATWTGGSLNLLAVAEILQLPQGQLGILIIADTILAYSWMAGLLALSRWAKRPYFYDSPKPQQGVSDLKQIAPLAQQHAAPHRARRAAGWLLAIGITALAYALALAMPQTVWLNSVKAWHLVVVSLVAVIAAHAPWLNRTAAYCGYEARISLYWVLAAIGTQGSWQTLHQDWEWLCVGILVLVWHGLCLACSAYLLRLPLGAAATVSQANIGGVISAPVVAAAYHPRWIPLALISAVFYGALGTYAGLLCAELCR